MRRIIIYKEGRVNSEAKLRN